MKTGKQIKVISILNTNAHHRGYPADGIQEYMGNVEAYVTPIPLKFIRIWRTGKTDNSPETIKMPHVGTWALGKKLENASSTRLNTRCELGDWVAGASFCAPNNREIENIETRHIHDGKQTKKIDCIPIEPRYRNWVKKLTIQAYPPLTSRCVTSPL